MPATWPWSRDLSWIGGEINCITEDLGVNWLHGGGFVWDCGEITGIGDEVPLQPRGWLDQEELTSSGDDLGFVRGFVWGCGEITSIGGDLALVQELVLDWRRDKLHC
jgi:hypothetical protein